MKKKILIVEDNPQNLKLFRDLLEVAGFDILEAGDGKSGLAMAREHHPDLIILDFLLPDMNGLELGTILDEESKTKGIPCVFVTASVLKEEREKITEIGCFVISKPINTRTFAKDVTQFIK